VHLRLAEAGLLGVGFPEEVGGCGGDAVDAAVVADSLISGGASSGLLAALFTHGIALPHIVASGDARLIDTYVRPTLAGRTIGALAITEPGGGSDVAALRTTARRQGSVYLVNGAKTYITSGARADFVTTLVRTGGSGPAGLSLLVVDTDLPGFQVVRRLAKLGWLCSDTAELAYVDVAVPADRLIGSEGGGFAAVVEHFPGERLALAVHAGAIARRCVALALAWCRERDAFGDRLITKQVVRHRLVEMFTETEVTHSFTMGVLVDFVAGKAGSLEAAMAKNAAVAVCAAVADAALQLHGGLGYMHQSEINRHYRDARVLSIGGGATEVMKDLIAHQLGW
jgi:acyl-CoA dehydrogenase